MAIKRRHFLISSTAMGATFLFKNKGYAQQVYGCNYVRTPNNGFSLVENGWLNDFPISTKRVMDFGIDRQSFLDRGWTDEQIGRWNPQDKRKSLFLSAFYALAMNNANEPNHPWNEPSHDWDRGLGAHIDYWTKQETGKPFYLYTYDSLNAPSLVGRIVGRRTNEAPFNGSKAIGNAPGRNGEIFINTDIDWALGERMDVNTWVGTKFNLSHVIAHEAGHWFGFDHTETCPKCMMNRTVGGNFFPRWQERDDIMNPLFAELARKLD